jgi:hypothetical protein
MCATSQFILDIVNYQVRLLIEFAFVLQALWLSETHGSFLNVYLSPGHEFMPVFNLS